MKKLMLLTSLLMLLAISACREDISIDLEKGEPMIGVEGSFTDAWTRHEVILSYTSDFYNRDSIQMITGARVCVTDGVDTIPYLEQVDHPGHYLTDSVAGRKNTLYRLMVDVPSEEEPDGYKHLIAESYMGDNVEAIDSLVLKPSPLFDGLPMRDTIYMLYPYFQSLPDPSIVYMVHLTEDGVSKHDTLYQVMSIPMAGYAGFYVNGPEMLANNVEIPVGMMMSSELHEGEVIRLDLLSIPSDYMMFTFNVKTSMGSNPLLGPPTNVMTNIQPAGAGVGWFYAASVVSAETVFHRNAK